MMKDNLRKWRRLARMSQEKLADEMQVSRQTISKWENGETYPSTGHVLELARILGCGVDELMGRSVKYGVDGSIGGKTKREVVELTSAEHEGNETNGDVLCDGAVDVCYNGISRTRHNETSSVRGGRIVFWMNSVAIAIMMLVGVSGIVTGCFLHDGVKETGFDRMVDGSLVKAFDEFEKDGYVRHEVVGYGITEDAKFYVKCSLDGEGGPCAALVYFCETDEGYSCEYLDDPGFVPEGRYYEVG